MKVVIDTNVLLGACSGTGAASQVLRACLQGRFTPLIGNALFNEIEDVFGRNDLFKTCPLSSDERDELLDLFFTRCQWIRVYYAWRPNLPDEADNHLVELAVAGGADFIVTRNLRDVVRMELRFPNLRVIPPEDFLKEI